MDMDELVDAVFGELKRAESKFPGFPVDPLHALAVLGEEYGELTQAVLQRTYEPERSSLRDVRREAIQTAAMALRFVLHLDAYEYRESRQTDCAANLDAKDKRIAELESIIRRVVNADCLLVQLDRDVMRDCLGVSLGEK